MESTCSGNATGAAAAPTSEPPTGTVTTPNCDQKGLLEVSEGDGNKEAEKDVIMDDLGKENQQEEEVVGEREQNEEVKQLVKEGMESLLPVLGEEVTAKVGHC